MKRLWRLYYDWIENLPWPVALAIIGASLFVLVSVVRWCL